MISASKSLTIDGCVHKRLHRLEHVDLGGVGAEHPVERKVVRLLVLIFSLPPAPGPGSSAATAAAATAAAAPSRVHDGKLLVFHAQDARASQVFSARESAALLFLGSEANDDTYRLSTSSRAAAHFTHGRSVAKSHSAVNNTRPAAFDL